MPDTLTAPPAKKARGIAALRPLLENPAYIRAVAKRRELQEQLAEARAELVALVKKGGLETIEDEALALLKGEEPAAPKRLDVAAVERHIEVLRKAVHFHDKEVEILAGDLSSEAGGAVADEYRSVLRKIRPAAEALVAAIQAEADFRRRFRDQGFDEHTLPFVAGKHLLSQLGYQVQQVLEFCRKQSDPV